MEIYVSMTSIDKWYNFGQCWEKSSHTCAKRRWSSRSFFNCLGKQWLNLSHLGKDQVPPNPVGWWWDTEINGQWKQNKLLVDKIPRSNLGFGMFWLLLITAQRCRDCAPNAVSSVSTLSKRCVLREHKKMCKKVMRRHQQISWDDWKQHADSQSANRLLLAFAVCTGQPHWLLGMDSWQKHLRNEMTIKIKIASSGGSNPFCWLE